MPTVYGPLPETDVTWRAVAVVGSEDDGPKPKISPICQPDASSTTIEVSDGPAAAIEVRRFFVEPQNRKPLNAVALGITKPYLLLLCNALSLSSSTALMLGGIGSASVPKSITRVSPVVVENSSAPRTVSPDDTERDARNVPPMVIAVVVSSPAPYTPSSVHIAALAIAILSTFAIVGGRPKDQRALSDQLPVPVKVLVAMRQLSKCLKPSQTPDRPARTAPHRLPLPTPALAQNHRCHTR